MGENQKPAREKLKALRESLKIPMSKVSELMGYAFPGGYSHWEVRYKEKYIPVDVIEKIRPLFKEYGATDEQLDDLAGIKREGKISKSLLSNIFKVVFEICQEQGIGIDHELLARCVADLYDMAKEQEANGEAVTVSKTIAKRICKL